MKQRSKIKHQPSRITLPSLFICPLLFLVGGCPSKTPQNGEQKSEVRDQRSEATTDLRPPASVASYGYRVIKEYPHDPCAFTQGLAYENGFLYEGTGLYGQSKLIKRDFKTWAVVKQIDLPGLYFGEGITLVGARIIQLTWQEHAGFVYDKNTLAEIRQFPLATEGWGLTYDGRRLILSDGSNVLSFLDPNTFSRLGQIRVTDRNRMVRFLNELEYISDPAFIQTLKGVRDQGSGIGNLAPETRTLTPVLLANILGAYTIAIIAPQTGHVTGWIDLTGIYTPEPDAQDNFVLNGIAYLPENKHLLVTGKCWTKMFEIELVRRGQ